jgi:hypothetical protein
VLRTTKHNLCAFIYIRCFAYVERDVRKFTKIFLTLTQFTSTQPPPQHIIVYIEKVACEEAEKEDKGK